MERSINDKEKEMIINFGAFGYSISKMSNILGWPLEDVKNLYLDKESNFSNLYNQGKDKAEYVIDMKLFEMAQGGDLKALNEFEKRKKKTI